MLNHKKKLFSLFFSGIILATFLIPAGAVGEWAVEQGDIYKFDITEWNDDDIELDGYFEFEVTDLDSNGDLTYDITCFFEVDVNDDESYLEVSDVVTSTSIGIYFFVALLFTVADFDDFKADVDNEVNDMEDSYETNYGSNENITYSIKELTYGWDVSLEDTGTNETTVLKWQWDEEGVLKHWEWTVVDGTGKSGILIKQQGFDIMEFIQSIPGYSLGCLLPVLFISASILVVLKRKKL